MTEDQINFPYEDLNRSFSQSCDGWMKRNKIGVLRFLTDSHSISSNFQKKKIEEFIEFIIEQVEREIV